jgi:hypothetical protein
MTIQIVIDGRLKGAGKLPRVRLWCNIRIETYHIPDGLARMVEPDPESDLSRCVLEASQSLVHFRWIGHLPRT